MISIENRPSIRGLKKCPSCGKWNGVKAKACKNKNCTLSITYGSTAKRKPLIEPVQLICHEEYKLYSVRVRDRGPEIRNFVKITDRTISSDSDGSIISRHAICYIDTCKYDSNDVNISCKHVKNASSTQIKGTVYEIRQNMLSRLNLANEVSARLWEFYTKCKELTPVIQRISKSVFAVKCDPSQSFAAGFLHVYLNGDGSSDGKGAPKYCCACKKIRISLTPNESVIVQQDNCDHLYLVIGAILSDQTGNAVKEFQRHIDLFMKSDDSLNQPIDEIIRMAKTNERIENTEEFIDDFNSFCDLSVNFNDNPLKLEETNEEDVALIDVSGLVDCCLDNVMTTDTTTNYDNIEGLELNCEIELMDQFKLTDHIDLCQSEIELSDTSDLLGGGSQSSWFPGPILSSAVTTFPSKKRTNSHMVIDLPPMIETLCTDDQSLSTKKSKLTRKLELNHSSVGYFNGDDDTMQPPSLDYQPWLDSVIERINGLMDFNGNGHVDRYAFSVSHTFFDYFRLRFSVGVKRRLPDTTTIIRDRQQYAGLTMHTWKFQRLEMVKRIFHSENIPLEMERLFIEIAPGRYKSAENLNKVSFDKNYCTIRPSLYKTFLCVGPMNTAGNNSTHATPTAGVFIIDWIPGVLSRSEFGEMRITFRFGFKRNNEIIEKKDKFHSISTPFRRVE